MSISSDYGSGQLIATHASFCILEIIWAFLRCTDLSHFLGQEKKKIIGAKVLNVHDLPLADQPQAASHKCYKFLTIFKNFNFYDEKLLKSDSLREVKNVDF